MASSTAIVLHELDTAVDALNLGMDDAMVKKAFEEVDTNGSGDIDFGTAHPVSLACSSLPADHRLPCPQMSCRNCA